MAARARGVPATSGVPIIRNVLPGLTDVHEDQQLASVEDLSRFYRAAKAGTLPSVSWICSNGQDSEHPPALVSLGRSYVTSIVNASRRSPSWNSVAIFIIWDDWGGFYDHVVPPRGRFFRVWYPRSCTRHQPLCKTGIYWSSDAQL